MTETRDTLSPTVLHTLLGDYPTTHALRHGSVTSPFLRFEFADVPVPNRAFKRVVRECAFDVAELALMSFLIARSHGVSLRLLPVVIFSRNPLPHFICNVQRRRLTPDTLRGCRVGVRMFSTTTAVWIRELLSDQYGVEWSTVKWTALDEGHVAGVPDPLSVERHPGTGDLMAMLRDGALDAAIVDKVPDDPSFAPVVPEADATYRAWERKHNARTLNHVVVVRESLADDERSMRELFRLFRESRAAGKGPSNPPDSPLGFEANRRNLDVAIAVASAQGLLARPLQLDDLVTPTIAALG